MFNDKLIKRNPILLIGSVSIKIIQNSVGKIKDIYINTGAKFYLEVQTQ